MPRSRHAGNRRAVRHNVALKLTRCFKGEMVAPVGITTQSFDI